MGPLNRLVTTSTPVRNPARAESNSAVAAPVSLFFALKAPYG
jgi:hypothetical protein